MMYINYTLKSTKQPNKQTQKEIRFSVTRGGDLGEEELNEGI